MTPQPEPSRSRARLYYPSAALLLMTAAFLLTKTGRDALYFEGDGLFDLPWAYLGIAFLSLPVSTSVLAGMRSIGPRKTRIISSLAMAAFQVVFYFIAEPGGGWLMTFTFVLIPVVYGVLLAQMWLFGAELLDRDSESQRTSDYATLGAASMSGAALGGLTAKLLAPYVDPQFLVLLSSGLIVASVCVAVRGHQRFAPSQDAVKKAAPQAADGLMPSVVKVFGAVKHRYVRILLFVAMMTALVGMLIEFQFYVVASVSEEGLRDTSDFFANWYLVLTGGALLIQVLVMPALQRRVGVQGSLMVLPMALLAGAAALAVSASAVGRAALRVAEGGLKSSIHRSNWEQAYLPLDPSQRSIAKVLVDGMGAHIAEGIGAVLLLIWLGTGGGLRDLSDLNTAWVTYAILGGVVVWMMSTYVLSCQLAPGRCLEIRKGKLDPDIPVEGCCRVTAALGEDYVSKPKGPREERPAAVGADA